MEPSSAGQGKWRRQSERRTPNCRSDKTTIQRNDVPRGTMDETSSLWTLVSAANEPRSMDSPRVSLQRRIQLVAVETTRVLEDRCNLSPRSKLNNTAGLVR